MTVPGPIRVLIADDHKLVRRGLVSICERKGGFEIVGEAENGRQAVALAGQLKPDVIIMDIRMPELDGIAATAQIMEANPAARVIMLTMHGDDRHVFAAIQAGAQGYFLKNSDDLQVVDGVRSVYLGHALMDVAIASRVLDAFRQLSNTSAGSADQSSRLTPAEMDVLLLVARGADNLAIAEQLNLAPSTVGNRLSQIYAKLRVTSRTQAALEALRRGWATLDDDG